MAYCGMYSVGGHETSPPYIYTYTHRHMFVPTKSHGMTCIHILCVKTLLSANLYSSLSIIWLLYLLFRSVCDGVSYPNVVIWIDDGNCAILHVLIHVRNSYTDTTIDTWCDIRLISHTHTFTHMLCMAKT